VAADPSLRGRVELHLAGALTEGDLEVAGRHDFVRTRGLLTHERTVALMRSADLLFLPMQDLPVGTRAGLIPYKTFEYLGAERPILAAVPDGDVRDMLAPLEHTAVVRPADVEGMAAALREQIGRGPITVVRPGVDELERRACVARIASVLDDVLARGKAVPRLAA
jgi:glycosyltransferase involved in cell wall biosynthesis